MYKGISNYRTTIRSFTGVSPWPNYICLLSIFVIFLSLLYQLQNDLQMILHPYTESLISILLMIDLNIIDNWSKQWAVTFNPSKSHALHIISKARTHTTKHFKTVQ